MSALSWLHDLFTPTPTKHSVKIKSQSEKVEMVEESMMEHSVGSIKNAPGREAWMAKWEANATQHTQYGTNNELSTPRDDIDALERFSSSQQVRSSLTVSYDQKTGNPQHLEDATTLYWRAKTAKNTYKGTTDSHSSVRNSGEEGVDAWWSSRGMDNDWRNDTGGSEFPGSFAAEALPCSGVGKQGDDVWQTMYQGCGGGVDHWWEVRP